MIKINFDLEEKFDKTALEQGANDAEVSIRHHLDIKTGFDEHKSMQQLKKYFTMADYDNSGAVDFNEFEKITKMMNVLPHHAILRYLFDRYDANGDGRLPYSEFCGSLFGKHVMPMKQPMVAVSIDRVRAKLLERGMSEMRGLSRVFRIMDSNRNQLLSSTEFKNGLLRYGVELSPEEFQAVMRAFDRDGKGISVTEFMACLRGKLNPRRQKLVELAFTQLDKDGTGKVEFAEICRIYDATRHPEVLAKQKTVEEVLLQFISGWDKNADGIITLLEFVDYYKDLSCLIDLDDYFELMIRNAWHLAGGEGWCANTSNLRVCVVHEDDSEEIVCITNDLGLDPKDTEAIREALMDEGVQNIKKVKIAM